MKALMKIAEGPGNIEVREVPTPILPADDWVLIEVKAAGVCGTDLHIWHDEFTYYPPVVLGHEFSGKIVEAGPSVKDFVPGDRVVAEPHSKFCGHCYLCRTGRIQLCKSKRSPGWGIDGAMTNYLTMPSVLLHHIPEEVDFSLAALTEPLAIVFHQITERVHLESQDFVVITGSGPMGILAAFVAKHSGADKVVMTGISSGLKVRFGVARELGADYIVNVEKENPVDKVYEMTGGRGSDLVIETSGAPPAIKQAIEMVRTCGKLSCIGLPGDDMTPIAYKSAMKKAIDMHFNMSSSYTGWEKALKLLRSHGEELRLVITEVSNLEEWENVFRSMEREEAIKPVFVFK